MDYNNFNYLGWFDSFAKKQNIPEENSLFEAVCNGNEKYLLAAIAKNPNCVNTVKYCHETQYLLGLAILHKQVGILRILMNSKLMEMNVPDLFGRTPLMQACSFDNTEITNMLISHSRVDLNYMNDNNTALTVCIKNKSVNCFHLLTSEKNLDVNRANPLRCAICKKSIEFVERLLTLGARLDFGKQKTLFIDHTMPPILYKWRSYLPDWTVFNHKRYPKEFKDTVFILMYCYNQFAICKDIKRLLIRYVSKGWKTKKDVDVAKMCVNGEVMLDAITYDPSCIDQSILKFAVVYNKIDVLNICLSYVENINIDNQCQLLTIAVETNRFVVLDILLSHKKSLHISPTDIYTALYHSCEYQDKRIECFQYLLKHNVIDINCKVEGLLTLLENAFDSRSYKIVDILQFNGAK